MADEVFLTGTAAEITPCARSTIAPSAPASLAHHPAAAATFFDAVRGRPSTPLALARLAPNVLARCPSPPRGSAFDPAAAPPAHNESPSPQRGAVAAWLALACSLLRPTDPRFPPALLLS